MKALKLFIYKKIIKKRRMKRLKKYGENVTVCKRCTFVGHIQCGNNVFINEGAYFVSSKAKLIIGDNVLFGPNVTIYTGNHATDIVGKYINEVTDEEKDLLEGKYDEDVIIEGVCWIGTRAIILKGVRVGEGAIIGAGAVVTKDVPAHSIYVGVPQARIMPRFTEEELVLHKEIMKERKTKGFL